MVSDRLPHALHYELQARWADAPRLQQTTFSHCLLRAGTRALALARISALCVSPPCASSAPRRRSSSAASAASSSSLLRAAPAWSGKCTPGVRSLSALPVPLPRRQGPCLLPPSLPLCSPVRASAPAALHQLCKAPLSAQASRQRTPGLSQMKLQTCRCACNARTSVHVLSRGGSRARGRQQRSRGSAGVLCLPGQNPAYRGCYGLRLIAAALLQRVCSLLRRLSKQRSKLKVQLRFLIRSLACAAQRLAVVHAQA